MVGNFAMATNSVDLNEVLNGTSLFSKNHSRRTDDVRTRHTFISTVSLSRDRFVFLCFDWIVFGFFRIYDVIGISDAVWPVSAHLAWRSLNLRLLWGSGDARYPLK